MAGIGGYGTEVRVTAQSTATLYKSKTAGLIGPPLVG
jgi:hypothetical protein